MRKQRIGCTAVEASRIAYGCGYLGGEWNLKPLTEELRTRALEALRAAIEEGIDFFDMADAYSCGKSEEAFSQLWRDFPGLREHIAVQSKCGCVPAACQVAEDSSTLHSYYDFSYGHIVTAVEGSLKRLDTDYLDSLLLHRPDPLVEPEEVAKAFDKLHGSGKVRHFGVSNHSGAQIELLRNWVSQPLVVNQLELSLLHTDLIDAGVTVNSHLPERHIRSEQTLEYCRRHNITIQALSPLARGFVCGRLASNADERARAVSAAVREMSIAKNAEAEAIAVAWILRHPATIQVIIGSTQPQRIRAACQADRIELSRNEWNRLYVAALGMELL